MSAILSASKAERFAGVSLFRYLLICFFFSEWVSLPVVFTCYYRVYVLLGTYKVVEKIPWTTLLSNEFGSPDWVKMYPINDKGLPVGPLSPRLACKLFHDALFIIKKGEESPKYIQDRIPEAAHKCFKKKQWRKQFYESMRRVACRLAVGHGFRPNCVGEDAFIHVILNQVGRYV